MDHMESLLSRPEDPTDIDVDKVAKTYVDLLKTPVLSSGAFLQESNEFLNIYTEWGFVDVVNKEKGTLVKQYSILKASLAEGNPVVASTTSVPYANTKLTRFSPCGSKRVILTEEKGNGAAGENGTRGEILSVYSDQQLLKTFDLKKLDKHKEIYINSQWGSGFVWSQDGTKLAYLAEKKLPKAEPFFTTPGNAENANPPKEPSRKGEEFAFRQSWGEQLQTCFENVIVVLDLETEEFKIIELPHKLFPSDLQFVNNTSLIATGYVDPDWRLGLIYCTNRESRIFQIGIDGTNFRFLSNPGRAAMSPRVSPDATFVIWQERGDINGVHEKSREIMGLKIEEKLESPRMLYTTNPGTMVPVYNDFPAKCWSLDSKKFFVVTINDLDSVLLDFNLSNDYRVIGDPFVTRGIESIYSIGKDYILASRSSTIESPALFLLSIETKQSIQLTSSTRIVSRPVYRLPLPGSVSPPSFYYGPAGDDVKKNSVPLIVMPHGGPHSVHVDTFVPEVALCLNLGYGIVKLNYVGSIGGTADVTGKLPGKIGILDVQDCQATVQSLLSQEKTLDPSKVVVHGGSHGGFLGAHLTSSYPDVYKAASLRNPAIDLLAMVSVSDITEWSYVEAGVKDTSGAFVPSVKSLEDARKYIECSPIQHVNKVKAPTLLLLGSEDLRVPMSQGLAYYRALKAAGKTAEVRVYNDCHPLGKVPCRFDSMLHTLLWFSKFLKK